MTPPPTNRELIHAYRSLYKHLLAAVQYSKPSRYIARNHLRDAFRNPPTSSSTARTSSSSASHSSTSTSSYDPSRISKTLQFLSGAAKTKGIEHKILKNLMHVWWERERLGTLSVRGEDLAFRQRAHGEFDRTLERFNEGMGTCLR